MPPPKAGARKGASLPRVTPRNASQRRYLELLTAGEPAIVIAAGAAGTGKTHLASVVGAQKLCQGDVQRIIVTRPAVSVDEEHGFLPGSLEDKMGPWVKPIFDALRDVFTPAEVTRMVYDNVIELVPLAYCRGRSFKHAWVICDEAQNTTPGQMLMLLTRLGEGSKMVVTGDTEQSDLAADNGLADLLAKLANKPCSEMQVVSFAPKDAQRHAAVKSVLELYATPSMEEAMSMDVTPCMENMPCMEAPSW